MLDYLREFVDKIRFQIKLAEEAGEARMEDFELQNIEYKVIWKKEFLDEICGMANGQAVRYISERMTMATLWILESMRQKDYFNQSLTA